MEDRAADFAFTFLSILFEGVPFLFLGTLISGWIDVYLPGRTIERLLPKNRVLAVLAACLMGLVLPVCECTAVPVMRRLVLKGFPVACAVSYILASPVVNPVSIFNTYQAFYRPDPWFMVGSRFGLTVFLAFLVGVVLLRVPVRSYLNPSVMRRILEQSGQGFFGGGNGGKDSAGGGDRSRPAEPEAPPLEIHEGGRLVAAARVSIRDFLDVLVYFAAGAMLATVFKESPLQARVETLAENPFAATPVLMIFAFASSLCSSSDALIIAQFNFDYGPRLAFLVFGPMMDFKLAFLYLTLFKARFVAVLSVSLFLVIWMITWNWSGWVWPIYFHFSGP